MKHLVFAYLQKQNFQLVEDSFVGVINRDASCVTNEFQYRQKVVQQGWYALPLPIRLMGRRDILWDDYYSALKEEILDLDEGIVKLRPDAKARIARLAGKFFGPADVPLAKPVKQPSPPPPMAPPVSPGKKPAAHPGSAEKPEVPSDSKGEGAIAVGIDLGTTFSLVAYVDAEGRPTCISNAAGERLTPSVVLFEDEGTVVGKEAVQASAMEPEKVAECAKRDMGAKFYRKKVNGEYLPPEVICSFILRSLKADAERTLGPVQKAVITVPAYFEETRRRATMDAGKLAGLEILDIINEPTAAAIAYGYKIGFLDRQGRLKSDHPLRVLVFDLGGGTFDVTIVEIKDKSFKALATDGDAALGGKDWDEKLMAIAADRFKHKFREDPRANPASLQELGQAAESAKRTLTERQKAAIFVNHLGSRLKVEVTRQEFEEASAALLERTRMTTEIVARQAGLAWTEIDRVLLVGGATRMPMVIRMLEELTGKQVDRSLSPDEAVAEGAALYAELLAPRKATSEKPRFSVTNVNSHSLGIQGTDPKTGLNINKILVPKNTPLPHTVTKRFKTARHNQRNVVIKVLEGESERPEHCTQVGTCAIRELPEDLPEGWPVEVSYTYEANGRLHVTAKLKGHKAEVTTDFDRENSMPDDDLDLWKRFVQEEVRCIG